MKQSKLKTVKTDHNERIIRRRLSKHRVCQRHIRSGNIYGRKKFLKEKQTRGVVFLSHIPHGFYEEQIEAYFSQFGKVTAASVPRSKVGNKYLPLCHRADAEKLSVFRCMARDFEAMLQVRWLMTGRSRGYAFIEFKHPEVGEIAAETMNNYIMSCRLLKAEYIAPENQKPRLFSMAKASRETHRTAADKAALAVKHNRKLKNRHLKLGLEAKCAAKLLKKAKLMKSRARKLGLSHDFTVGETELQSVLKRLKK